MTDFPIITIGRECGSGGHDIGVLLAEKLGIPAYDNEALAQEASESGLAPQYFSHVDQQHTSAWAIALSSKPIDDEIYHVQYETCRKLAAQGSAVMIGRCADSILRGYAPCFNIFIQCDEEKRIQRIMQTDKIPYVEAKKRMLKIDKCRAAYYNYYTEGKWGERLNYNLVVSSDAGVEATAELIYNAVKNFIAK